MGEQVCKELGSAAVIFIVVSCSVGGIWAIPVPLNKTYSLSGLTHSAPGQDFHEVVSDFNKSRLANVSLNRLNASLIKPPDHLEGRVSWDEYHVNFMIEKGFDNKYAKNHPEDHKTLDRDHENGDEHLSEDEFAQLGPDETRQKTKDEWKRERLQEFHQNIDLNGDGLASRQELLMYNDPENPVHARSEARELVLEADSNGDQQLSLEEVLAKKDVFLGSKMVNTAKNIHDEF
ncbi:hypothetical protein HPB48_025558 [Haemaphysalis longicornis]|uniref:Stromal cell-derived factor 4 n=1 Tax=Haemaphysalis longicornis TaxID=44386 RepID=A0A9J6H939_HAELO|nr:hypothetical protein HPB48_025558 [Haemaphysalis longicornis]